MFNNPTGIGPSNSGWLMVAVYVQQGKTTHKIKLHHPKLVFGAILQAPAIKRHEPLPSPLQAATCIASEKTRKFAEPKNCRLGTNMQKTRRRPSKSLASEFTKRRVFEKEAKTCPNGGERQPHTAAVILELRLGANALMLTVTTAATTGEVKRVHAPQRYSSRRRENGR